MRLPELPWTWIGAAAAVLVAGVVLLRVVAQWRRRGRGADHPGSAHPRPETGAVAAPEQRALLLAANEVRGALEKQAQQMAELRAYWSRRLDRLEERIGALAPAGAPPREDGWSARPAPGAGASAPAPYEPWPTDLGMTASGTISGGGTIGGGGTMGDGMTAGGTTGGGGFPSLPEPAWSPGPGDQPVEVRDGALVASRSLPPAGYVAVTGAGQARVYLNADVQLTEFSLPKWAAFFDLEPSRPYAAYRTRRPAEVRWDASAGRGELVHKGQAEAI